MPEMNNFKSGNNIYEVADSKARGISLTWAQYQALSYEEQHNGTAYYITDMDAIYPVDHELNANSRNAVANDIVTPHILAMENVLGAKNVLPFFAISTVLEDVTWTVDNSKKIITVNGTATNWSYQEGHSYPITLKAGQKYILSSGVDSSNQYNVYVHMYDARTIDTLCTTENGDVEYTPQTDTLVYFNIVVRSGATVSNVVIKPMIRPAGTDPTYVPYAMTNKELTDKVVELTNVTPQQISEPTISLLLGGVLKYGRLCIVQLRFETTSSTPASGVLYSGLPKPFLFNNLTYDAVFLTSNNGKASVDAQGTLYYGDATPGNSIIVTGAYIWSETGY